MDSRERFERQLSLRPLALVRLHAEYLLQHADNDSLSLTEAQRETLGRIAVAPTEVDREFLSGFDRLLEAPQ